MPRTKVIKEPVYKKQKSANIYQQTFLGLVESEWDFRFTRVYKSRPENRLIIKSLIVSVMSSANTDKPFVVYLRNAPEINGKSNMFFNYGGFETTYENPFVLGVSGAGNYSATGLAPPSVMVNDLPLNNMKVSVRHLDNSLTGNVSCFVMFEIEEIEEV
jgi:hypothetical protein